MRMRHAPFPDSEAATRTQLARKGGRRARAEEKSGSVRLPGWTGRASEPRNLGGGLMKGGTSGAVTRSKKRSWGWQPGILRASRYLHRRHSLSAFTSWSTSPGSLKRFSCDSRMRAGSPPLSTRNKSRSSTIVPSPGPTLTEGRFVPQQPPCDCRTAPAR